LRQKEPTIAPKQNTRDCHYVIRAFSHVKLIINQSTYKYRNRLCGASADRWTRPLAFLSLIKRVRAFQVTSQRIFLFHLIDANLHTNYYNENESHHTEGELTIQFSDVNASSALLVSTSHSLANENVRAHPNDLGWALDRGCFAHAHGPALAHHQTAPGT